MSDKAKGWVLAFIQFALMAVIMLVSAYEFKVMNRPLVPIIHYIGVTLILLGVMFFMVVVLNFGQLITPNPVPRDKAVLRTTGIYKYIRHPMYTSALGLFLGIALYFQAYYSIGLVLVLFIFFVFKTSAEEKFLRKKFREYSSYSSSSKRFLPFIY